MKRVLAAARGDAGATILESMIAFTIFATAAIGIYPLIAQVRSTNKGTDVRQLCQSVVKAKLSEYQTGRAIDWDSFTGTGDDSDSVDLKELSMVSASASDSSGFMYAKLRYNQLIDPDGSTFVACEGQSKAEIFGAATRVLGMRECVGSNVSWRDAPSASRVDALWGTHCGGNDVDENVNRELPGFKLYVKLERFSPWSVAGASPFATAAAGGDRRFHPTCPNSNSGTLFETVPRSVAGTYSRPLYDFNASGDQVRVTVTGVIDAKSVLGPAATAFAGFSVDDMRRLTCQASALVAPPPSDYRFLLSVSDIRGSAPSVVQAISQLTDGDDSTWPQNRQVFRSFASGTVVTPDSPDMGFSAYRGMVVHPLNLSVYALRGSSIVRYSQCGGVPLDCNVDGSTSDAPEDNGTGTSLPRVDSLNLSTGGDLEFDAILARFDPSAASAADATTLFGWRRGGCELRRLTQAGSGVWSVAAAPEESPELFGDFGSAGCSGVNLAESVRALFMDPAGTSAFYLRDSQVGGSGADLDYFAVYSAHDSLGLYRYSLIKGGDVRAVSK